MNAAVPGMNRRRFEAPVGGGAPRAAAARVGLPPQRLAPQRDAAPKAKPMGEDQCNYRRPAAQ